jgi:hypothetical protein
MPDISAFTALHGSAPVLIFAFTMLLTSMLGPLLRAAIIQLATIFAIRTALRLALPLGAGLWSGLIPSPF